ncbi:MAG: membrane protein DedA with SNARE-associated domain [Natronomonas sp.]|jgi:membrane protein DedA with SNARE-associated domain|uniref:DedA family protein n=1 Tax=Natronomonas sp. TaxID=2184060 RepID=UPI003989AAFE
MSLGVPSGSSRLRRFLERRAVHMAAALTLVCAAVGLYLLVFADPAYTRELIGTYGFGALLFILVLEGAMLLYFAPSEALVPAAITLLTGGATDYVGIVTVIGVAVVGATIGQFALFTIAKRAGREYLLEQTWFRVSEPQLARFDGWFDRWGPLAVPLSNALLFSRGMLTVPAGLAEMDDKTFIALSALGTLLFQTWLAGLALFLGVRLGVL